MPYPMLASYYPSKAINNMLQIVLRSNYLVDSLIPFTRWITPTNVPKRFTTQMYLYQLPLDDDSSHPGKVTRNRIIVPTADGGIEHTEAKFDEPTVWLRKAESGEIILFPPQFFLMYLLSQIMEDTTVPARGSKVSELREQRRRILRFINTVPTASTSIGLNSQTSQIPWGEKVISPHTMFMRKSDGRVVLGLDKPGPELAGSSSGGDADRVVLVRFGKGGPRELSVKLREDVLQEERQTSDKENGDTQAKL
jgi:hypothetical protein